MGHEEPGRDGRNFAVAGAQNNIIYFVGGRDAGGQSTTTVMAYTIATNSWAFKASLPVNRRAANGASLLDGRLYVSGGISNTGGAAKTLYQYNPATNTWLKKANMPTASACGAQGVINGRLYVYAPAAGRLGPAGGRPPVNLSEAKEPSPAWSPALRSGRRHDPTRGGRAACRMDCIDTPPSLSSA